MMSIFDASAPYAAEGFVVELGSEKSTIVFPLPLDLIAPFLASTRPHPQDGSTT
jgi:hypothetical protein